MRKIFETVNDGRIWGPVCITVLAGVLAVVSQSPTFAQGPTPTPTPVPVVLDSPNDRFGLGNVSAPGFRGLSGGDEGVETRYQYAGAVGARWNRWVMLWSQIERSEGGWDFAPLWDQGVNDDVTHGVETLAILKNTPGWAQDPNCPNKGDEGCPPKNLYQPVFVCEGGKKLADDCSPGNVLRINNAKYLCNDGTTQDDCGEHEGIKGDNTRKNYWASFVHQTINRYKGQVRYWETWNEPDLEWRGDIAEFYRLLQVAYLTIHYADPQAKVLLPAFLGGGNRPFADLPYKKYHEQL